MRFVSVLAAATAVAAVPFAAEEKRAASPSVTYADGTAIGYTSAGIDSFKGLPFADPPVGQLRLRPPQKLSTNFGTRTFTKTPAGCPQFFTSVNTTNLVGDVLGDVLDSPFGQVITDSSEDCLTLNVQRPSTANSTSKLPVVIWIFGGGFEFGATQTYDGSSFIQKSMALGEPVIYVAIGYRIGGFGFLAGKELQADGSTNIGLRDQRLAMEWVQDNIAAFGGDPTKVTLWGESAGSISNFDHTIINGGDHSYKGGKLFRGVIMDSGSVVPAVDVSHPKAQTVYDTVVSNGGCGGAADTLACLRSLDFQTFLAAANSVPGIFSYSALDLSYVPRPDPKDNFFPLSPDILLNNGAFAKVPIIIGDQEDEGTLFSLTQSNITTNDDLIDYIAGYFPNANRNDVATVINTYPQDPAAGSPFGTGILYELYPQFKRLAAVLGDLTFTLTRRTYLSRVSQQVKAWSYLATYDRGLPVLGTFHVTDILSIYFGLPPAAQDSIQRYYISFINHLDPNAISTSLPLIDWPQWTNSNRTLVEFGSINNSLITDNFRSESWEAIAKYTSEFRV